MCPHTTKYNIYIYIYIYIYICFLVRAEGAFSNSTDINTCFTVHDFPPDLSESEVVYDAVEDEDCERTDRDSADRHRHSELINLGAAGAGKSGKMGVCVTSRVTTSFTASFLLGSSFTSRGVYNSTPCTKACHTTN